MLTSFADLRCYSWKFNELPLLSVAICPAGGTETRSFLSGCGWAVICISRRRMRFVLCCETNVARNHGNFALRCWFLLLSSSAIYDLLTRWCLSWIISRLRKSQTLVFAIPYNERNHGQPPNHERPVSRPLLCLGIPTVRP